MIPMMNQRLPHMPPHHSLGLLNSFMHHTSPLDLMQAHHHDHQAPRTYNNPPSYIPTDPSENECKIVDYRGKKVAAFIIQGETMLCLPQAFDLFLKNLVGGLHTVHSKLKRLDIVPLVCTVEQIRLLRGVGALQPGVNRCKLLSSKHFDVLYRDCTTARCLSVKPNESSRRGRPPKQGLGELSSYDDFTDDDAVQSKKYRMDEKRSPTPSRDENNDKSKYITSDYAQSAMHMQFMQMNQHRLAQSNAAMMSSEMQAQAQQLQRAIEENNNKNTNIANLNRANLWETCSASYESFVKNLERLRKEKLEEHQQSVENEKQRSSRNATPTTVDDLSVLNLSKNKRDRSHTPESQQDGAVGRDGSPEVEHHVDHHAEDASDMELSESSMHSRSPSSPPNLNAKLNFNQRDFPRPPPIAFPSTEILLRNIQELLKVVLENSIQQEQQMNFEKAELKMNALRERELNNSLEQRLTEEKKLRAMYQKRYIRDRKYRFRLQKQIEEEYDKHRRLEDILRKSGSNEILKNFIEIVKDDEKFVTKKNTSNNNNIGERSDGESDEKMSNSTTTSTDTKEKEISSPKSE